MNNHFGGDGLALARNYFALLRDYVLQDQPDIIGHFDLIRINNARLHLYDEESKVYRSMALDALKPMAETNSLLELNTRGVVRGYLKTFYPDEFLLKEWKAWGGEVIINSDCHDACQLDAYFDEAEEMLRSLGYDYAVRLGRKDKWERYSL